MLPRVIVAAACAGVIAVLAVAYAGTRACENGRRTLFGVVIGRLPAGREPAALRALQERCRGTDGLVAASAALQRQGRASQALAMAYRATRREPESATAWNAFAVAARAAGRSALARRAEVQARRLSPLGQEPATAPGSPPRAGGGPDGGP